MMTRKLSFIVLMPLLLVACSTPLPKREPSFSPVAPADLRPPAQSSGGIYQAGYDNRLFEDITARRVGDVLTVNLQERTNSIKKASTKDSKNDKISASLPTLFGLGALLLGGDMKTSAEAERKFEGKGDVGQSNQLSGLISVTVVELLPNGNLKIRGEKRVTLNQGDEFIRLSGIIRPVDIKPTNIIDSEKIADATFMYTGDGALNDTNSQGWLSRVFNSPWFPL
ncbi:MAG: flagellar basal body L-ring protein [Pseudomonadota bacterium]